MRGPVFGLLIGLGLGWLLFHEEGVPGRERAPEAIRGTPKSPGRANDAEEADQPAPKRALDPLPSDGNGYALSRNVDGRTRYTIDGVPIGTRSLAGIDAAMEAARAGKNWPEFLRCVLQLSQLDSPEADRRLVAILADESLSLRGSRVGVHFFEALKNSEIDGIAEAARTRARIEMVQNKDSQHAAVGFLSLVARFGEPEDHAWLESLATDGKGIVQADRAFAEGSAHPHAAARMKKRYLDSGIQPAAEWLYFARENPAVAFETAAELIRRNPMLIEPYRLLGKATTKETIATAHEVLARLPNDEARLLGLRAVQAMSLRKLDVRRFSELIATPRVVLERVLAQQQRGNEGDAAIRTLRYCTVAQTPENIAVLRTVAETGQPIAVHAKQALKILEYYRAQRSGWEPDRK